MRLISAINRIYKACGLNDLEQLEDAPEYDPNVVLTAELVEKYLQARRKRRRLERGRPAAATRAAQAPGASSG